MNELDIIKYIHSKTGIGLGDSKLYFEIFLKALKQRPLLFDDQYKLYFKWKTPE